MFGKTNAEENNGFADCIKLEKENIKLQLEVERLRAKLDIKQEQIENLGAKVESLRKLDANSIRLENEKLVTQIKEMEFEKAHDLSAQKLKTENAKLKSENEVQKSENEHLKKLLETYRNMPDVEQMIKNLSNLAVPSIDELKKFGEQISNDETISNLISKLDKTYDILNQYLSGGHRAYPPIGW